jgi:DNA-binding NtrC family response regulator
VLEQAAVLSSGPVIEEQDLNLGPVVSDDAAPPPAAGDDVPFREAKDRMVLEFERSYLLRALRAHGGNISRTAEAIGMVRQSLQQKIRELGLRAEDWSDSE